MKEGDKVVSDDYSVIGVIQKINNKLVVVGDFGSVDFNLESEFSDWVLYKDWKLKNPRRKLFSFTKKRKK